MGIQDQKMNFESQLQRIRIQKVGKKLPETLEAISLQVMVTHLPVEMTSQSALFKKTKSEIPTGLNSPENSKLC
jgi:hypothetical protein